MRIDSLPISDTEAILAAGPQLVNSSALPGHGRSYEYRQKRSQDVHKLLRGFGIDRSVTKQSGHPVGQIFVAIAGAKKDAADLNLVIHRSDCGSPALRRNDGRAMSRTYILWSAEATG